MDNNAYETLPRDDAAVPARPSATLVLLREGTDDLEVLLLRRGKQLAAFAGAWVFPGGVMESDDRRDPNALSMQTAARFTAVRELKEETGLDTDPAALVPLSRWTAPVIMPKRFDTWFFLARASASPVRVDQGEIHDYRWMPPGEALERHRAGRMSFFPPTWVTLHHLSAFHGCDAAFAAAAARSPFHYAPRVEREGADMCFLYGGDAAYGHGPIDQPGPRHRLWVRDSGWRYERTGDGVPASAHTTE